mmetsp:Transcript_37669/g.87494  ORF Transcript_37669/g.87494 Transcript_37669/m.87494 type:complete len:83 (-) Transcript_37669:13-261(-)
MGNAMRQSLGKCRRAEPFLVRPLRERLAWPPHVAPEAPITALSLQWRRLQALAALSDKSGAELVVVLMVPVLVLLVLLGLLV